MSGLNLKIEHATVGPFRGGQVVPATAVEGGRAEIDRLIALQAVRWTEEEPTDFFAAAATAVAEMPDDELTAENGRLKAEIGAVRQERNDALARGAANGQSAADAEIARLKAEIEALRGGPTAAVTAAEPNGIDTFDAAVPAPDDAGETPIDQQGDHKKKRKWGN